MKKLYYGLLMLGTLVGMQSVSFGAAAPEKLVRKVIHSNHGRVIVEYSKGNMLEGLIINCRKEGERLAQCEKTLFKHYFASHIEHHVEKLDATMFDELEAEYNKQEQQEQKKAAAEQVPGGYMVPNPAGGWMPKPESKESKEVADDQRLSLQKAKAEAIEHLHLGNVIESGTTLAFA